MSPKDQVAQRLIASHFEIEPHLLAVYRIVAEDELSATEPIKLLEVNAATVATRTITPFLFAPTQEVPFPTVIAEVTPRELAALQAGDQRLPEGWRLDQAQKYTRENGAR